MTPERLTSLARLLEGLAAESHPPTTVRVPEDALDGHLADSLAGLTVPALARAGRIADVGAGAGFPGLALAAALPAARVDLIEATGWKCAVIERLIRAAGLANARPLPLRVEELARGAGREAYAAVTARAVGPLAVLLEYAAPLLELGGVLVAWKGARAQDEERAGALAAAQLGFGPADVVKVTPFAAARSRHLHVYRKMAPTPDRFPRRPGVAARRPLGEAPAKRARRRPAARPAGSGRRPPSDRRSG